MYEKKSDWQFINSKLSIRHSSSHRKRKAKSLKKSRRAAWSNHDKCCKENYETINFRFVIMEFIVDLMTKLSVLYVHVGNVPNLLEIMVKFVVNVRCCFKQEIVWVRCDCLNCRVFSE